MLLQNQLKSFFETYPFPSLLIKTDQHFTIEMVNGAYQENPPFEISAGQNIEQLFPDNADSIKVALKQVIKSGKSLNTDIAIRQNHNIPALSFTPVLMPALTDDEKVEYIICSLLPLQDNLAVKNDSAKTAKFFDNQQQGNKDQLLYKLQQSLKEQECLYRISNLNERELSIAELLNKAASIIPEGFQYDDLAEAAIEFVDEIFSTPDFSETETAISTHTRVSRERSLHILVSYPENEIPHDGNPFLEEEKYLLDSIAGRLSVKLEQKIAQQELQEKQKLLDKAYHLAHIGTWEFDMKTYELKWSNLTKEVHGFGPDYDPDLESTINLFKEGSHRQTFKEAAYDAIENLEPFDVELKIISGKGDERWIRATGEPEYKNGECVRFYGISQNVTDRRKAEEHVLLNERRFRSLVQNASDLLAILDQNGEFTYVSPTSQAILGIPADNFIGVNVMEFIHPDDQKEIARILEDIAPGRQYDIEPYRFRNGENEWRWIETTATDMTNDDAVGGIVANSRDVTKQKNQEKKILEALKEKETLLSEIHHRVKNNLAVVSGMLQLQITENENSILEDKLSDSIIRIKAMANIHEQLYSSNSFSQLHFTENIRSLIGDIQKTMAGEADVKLHFNCDTVRLNINQAIPCSLIVNEVVTNIFKHAFPNRKTGDIRIEITKEPNSEMVHLSIADNGVGFPPDFELEKTDSLGTNLIEVLALQLEADYRYESIDVGTKFSIQFKIENNKGIGNNLF